MVKANQIRVFDRLYVRILKKITGEYGWNYMDI